MMKHLKQLLTIAVAVTILAVSINMFLGPHHIAAGGVSGIGILLEYLLGIDRAVVVMSFNVVLLVFAAIFLGKQKFLNTLVGSLMFPVALGLVPEITLTNDRLLSVIFGSVIFAVGVAILYKIQASSGGTTIPPLIFEKYFGLNTSVGLFLTDSIIVCLSLYVFGFEEFLFAIMSIAITSTVMTYIETGLKRRKAVMVITKHNSQEVKKQLELLMDKSINVFDVATQETQEGEMILIIASDRDYPQVKKGLDMIDPNSFMITYNVAEVHDLGFTYHPIQ